MFNREGVLVKDASEQMASTAALEINEERYGEGYIVFNHSVGYAKALEITKINMKLNDDYSPKNPYFTDDAKLYMYFFDDNLVGRKYMNDNLVQEFNFNYGDSASTVTDIKAITGKDFVIDKPCIVSVIDCGKPRMKVSFLAGLG